jgi:hypothetical protein
MYLYFLLLRMFNFLIVMYVSFFIVMYVLFSVFCLLFVCKCVLYYCHRVSTQLQLNIYTVYYIIYHIISFDWTQIWHRIFFQAQAIHNTDNCHKTLTTAYHAAYNSSNNSYCLPQPVGTMLRYTPWYPGAGTPTNLLNLRS